MKPNDTPDPMKPFSAPKKADDYDQIYQDWAASPRKPEDNAAAINKMMPAVRQVAKSHTGRDDDHVVSRARIMALEALRGYDPKRRVPVRAHLYQQLQGLKRFSSQQQAGIQVSERLLRERSAVRATRDEMTDELGREPSDAELAEKTGVPLKRLAKIKQFSPASTGTQARGVAVQDAGTEAADLWKQLVYDELEPMDQKIFEWTLGFNGHPVKPNQEIARLLKRTPGLVSQRKARIQQLLDREPELSPFYAGA